MHRYLYMNAIYQPEGVVVAGQPKSEPSGVQQPSLADASAVTFLRLELNMIYDPTVVQQQQPEMLHNFQNVTVWYASVSLRHFVVP